MVIDTLQLDIIVNNNKSASKINSVANAVNKLNSAVTALNGASLDGFTETIDTISSAQDLSDSAKSIGNVTKSLQKLEPVIKSFDDSSADGLKNTAKSIKEIKEFTSGSINTSDTSSKLSKALNIGSFVSKIYAIKSGLNKIKEIFTDISTTATEYEETLNLWQKAMGANTEQAKIFVNQMSKIYGLAESTTMQYQANFKNMLDSISDLNSDLTYNLSETLVQMALDYSSLFNTSFSDAMSKFQSALAGEQEAIRNGAGYDITEDTLANIYDGISGTKAITSLSIVEKRLLRILAIYQQMNDTAVGDYANTINDTANQIKYMEETIKSILSWIGVGVNQWLRQNAIITQMNTYLVAFKELAVSFARSMGYVETSVSSAAQSTIDNLLGAADETEGTWETINDEVDEYAEKLLGFDKFQVLSDSNASGTSSDVDDTIVSALNEVIEEYKRIKNDALDSANYGEMFNDATKFLEKLGFTANTVVDEVGNEITEWTKDGKTLAEVARDILNGAKGLLSVIMIFKSPLAMIGSLIATAYVQSEDFRESFDSVIKSISNSGIKSFQSLSNLIESSIPILNALAKGFSFVVDALDSCGALNSVISLIVISLVAWKVAQNAINIIKFANNVSTAVNTLITFNGAVQLTWQSTLLLSAGLATLISAISDLEDWDNMSGWERVSAILKAVAGAAFIAAAALAAFHSSATMGIAAVGIAAGIASSIAAVVSAQNEASKISYDVQKKAVGGGAQKGTLFFAGEAGPEIVAQTSGGGSTIMNMNQLEDAVANGYVRAVLATGTNKEDSSDTNIYVDGQKLFLTMRKAAKRNGYDFVKI